MNGRKQCSFYGCEAEPSEDDSRGLCVEHRGKAWYTVGEAAAIWHARERTVRDWIHPRGIVAAERNGRRPWRIPAEEFTRPHPSERTPSFEPQKEPLLSGASGRYRRTLHRVGLGAIPILGLMVAAGVVGTLNGFFRSPAGTPPSVAIEPLRPQAPMLAKVGEPTILEVAFTNTSEVEGEVYAAVSLRDPDGDWVDIRPLRQVHLRPGERGLVSWSYTPGRKGSWDVVYGIWSRWVEGQEPEGALGNSGILEHAIVAFQECGEERAGAAPVSVVGYDPFWPQQVKAGDTTELAFSFANLIDGPQRLKAGATVWDGEGNIAANGDHETVLESPLEPGETATVRWEHVAASAGAYQVQFAVWEAQSGRMVVRAPCPREKLVVAYPSASPAIAGIDPTQPARSAERQWITIHGENFTEESAVVLSILGNEYRIPKERTEFVSPEELRVLAGLTDPGTCRSRSSTPKACHQTPQSS